MLDLLKVKLKDIGLKNCRGRDEFISQSVEFMSSLDASRKISSIIYVEDDTVASK